MSPKKSSGSGNAQTRDPKEAREDLTPSQLSHIPSPTRFILVVLGSLVVSSVLFTLTSNLTQGDLGLISKHLEEWWEAGGLVAWRAVEVGLAWLLGFDSWDVASFLFLTHLPTYFLLSFFYHVRPTSALVSYAITIFSTVLPFAFLRRPASVHDLSHAPSGAVANRAILQDRLTTVFTSLAATSIFMVVIYISYASWLPIQLVLHFESIPDISAAHAGPAGLPVLFLTLVPAGFAVRDFLFASFAGSATAAADEDAPPASREGEYLVVDVYRKTWGRLSRKTQILASRTLILAAMILLNTTIQVAGTISCVSVQGAFTWGIVWAIGALATGATFGWIGAEI
ncbi:hypothetical protein N7492_008636 [Penicillium capsulatum]|uniref:Uncharacterized protein n=1 Tax=Penicillium capsulatum TaxID=69766 RepID=A0A9W9LH46_9EURO|nr:hypothetical protein N7492_008636 [Penicillium capsulatum]KAJ6106040.1 hypothetical protein N7512_009557 [Penicillium capsulatum]